MEFEQKRIVPRGFFPMGFRRAVQILILLTDHSTGHKTTAPPLSEHSRYDSRRSKSLPWAHSLRHLELPAANLHGCKTLVLVEVKKPRKQWSVATWSRKIRGHWEYYYIINIILLFQYNTPQFKSFYWIRNSIVPHQGLSWCCCCRRHRRRSSSSSAGQ